MGANVIAVPLPLPDPRRLSMSLERLSGVARDAGSRLALTSSMVGDVALGLLGPTPLSGMQWTTDEALAAAPSAGGPLRRVPNDVAFLQYTSGSTSAPKGVVVTHASLNANLEALRFAQRLGRDDHLTSWLPHYHDMGLVAGILMPLHVGFPLALMSPLDFLRKPERWLRAISRYHSTVTGAPNFAYDLCVRRVTQEQRAGLDLSSLEIAVSSSETVRAETIERFTSAFASCGFQRKAFYPAFGLAEATLFVTGGHRLEGPTVRSIVGAELGLGRASEAPAGAGGRPVVGCGRPAPATVVRIVEPVSRRPCEEGVLGEIWVAGPGVARGYWGQPELNGEVFAARIEGSEAEENQDLAFLRTGDLGWIEGGALFFAGRAKDVLVLGGAKYHPEDIERHVEQADAAIRPGCSAVVALEVAGQERLCVVAEVSAAAAGQELEIERRIRLAVDQAVGLPVAKVVLGAPGSLPKTSSGKIQRFLVRRSLAEDGAAPGQSRTREP
jgi:acyl-CoA synthetase (AMP-forming)/AMP-acid ligase II